MFVFAVFLWFCKDGKSGVLWPLNQPTRLGLWPIYIFKETAVGSLVFPEFESD